MKLQPSEFAYVLQLNDETGKAELFVIIEKSDALIKDQSVSFTLTDEGVVSEAASYLNPDMIKSLNEAAIPLHKDVCLLLINENGDVIDKSELPISVRPASKPAPDRH